MGPPESTSKGWILLFYRVGSKTGSTSGVFDRNPTLFKFKRSREINFIGPIFADDLQDSLTDTFLKQLKTTEEPHLTSHQK